VKSDPFLSLADFVRVEAANANVHLDTYDPEFIMGLVMHWLGEHDMVLDGAGLDLRNSPITTRRLTHREGHIETQGGKQHGKAGSAHRP
jgi:hypothetical protein